MHSVFGVRKYPKEMKENLKIEEYVKEFKLNEKNIKYLAIKVDRNVKLISETNIIFDDKYIYEEDRIRIMLDNLKENYDLILIDTTGDSKYKKLSEILKKVSTKVICVIEGNLMDIRKSLELLKKDKINKHKIEIVYNKKNKYTIRKSIIKIIFVGFKLLGEISYDNSYNRIINKSINKLYISKKIKKEYEKILNKLQII